MSGGRSHCSAGSAGPMFQGDEDTEDSKRGRHGDKKSHAKMAPAWFFMKVPHRWSPRGPAEEDLRIYFRAVRSETWMPSLKRNSSAIRSSAHRGFSWAIRWMRDLNSAGIGGRRGFDFHRQNRREASPCQRIRGAGRTMTSASYQLNRFDRRARGSLEAGAIHKV